MVLKCLAKVAQPCLFGFRQSTGDVGILVELFIELVATIHLLTNNGGCCQNNPGTRSLNAIDNTSQSAFKPVGHGATCRIRFSMPNIVDANVNNNHGRFLRQHVAFKPLFQIRHLVATDPSAQYFYGF